MSKITNRKEALAIKNKVCEVKEEYLKGDKCFDEFAKLEELTFEDDFCQYLIGRYAKLSRLYLDDSEEYSKEYGDENPSILCFTDILDYLDGIVSGNFADEVKKVVTISDGDIERTSHDRKSGMQTFISGVGKVEGGLISLLDLSMIIDDEE